TFGINVARFPRLQANYNFITNLRRNFGSCERRIGNLPYINVMNKARVIRDYVIKVARALESANDRIVSAFQDSNHAPLAPSFDAAIRFIPRYARNHTVTM